jgi:hypothetical protein
MNDNYIQPIEIQDFEEKTHKELVNVIHEFMHEMFLADADVITITINHADGVWYGTVTYLGEPEQISDEVHDDMCPDCQEKLLIGPVTKTNKSN